MKRNLYKGLTVFAIVIVILLTSHLLPSTSKTMTTIQVSGAWTPYQMPQNAAAQSAPKFNLNLSQAQDQINGDFFISPQGKNAVRRGKIEGNLKGQQLQLQLVFNDCDQALTAVGYYIPSLQMRQVISMPKLWVMIEGEDCQGKQLTWEGAMMKVMY